MEVQVNTRPNGKIVEGAESIALDVYDLTEWREKSGSDEKNDKQHILDTYKTKEERLKFVQQEQLRKLNETSYLIDDQGIASFTLPRFQNEKDAAYLVLSVGETGESTMLPIVIYLPQYDALTKQEGLSLLFNCKYDVPMTPTPPTTEPPSSEPPPSSSDEPPLPSEPIDNSWPRDDEYPNQPDYWDNKQFPSTNELIRNYCLVGLLLMIVGIVGLNRKQGGKKL